MRDCYAILGVTSSAEDVVNSSGNYSHEEVSIETANQRCQPNNAFNNTYEEWEKRIRDKYSLGCSLNADEVRFLEMRGLKWDFKSASFQSAK